MSVTARPGSNPVRSGFIADEVAVIVRVSGKPLMVPDMSVAARGAAGLARLDLERRAAVARVSDEVVRIDGDTRRAKSLAPRTRGEIVRREYTRVFTGLAARVRRETFDRLRSIQGVTGVWVDQTAQATLSESVPLIQADRVWNQFGDTGSGIRVAVIDTGVDYMHPDLGGCLEPDCKVYFGRDITNGDNDPMDDYGHGTHVAGIIAADGAVRGVAPDARIMAIKVLDQYGSGPFSDVIAGIELAADPDGTLSTNDGAQVMNISLGGPGDPDDPVSQAVDNAVLAGIVVAVAAGNSGPDWDTLGSPGCARLALTVGASDKTDQIAWFSSRGPARTTYQIKPDLLAPGVAITSTVPSGACFLCDPTGYMALDGTSMATPHVAGSAALALSRFPAWTPAQVRSAMLARSVDTGLDAFSQGSGRLDAYEAVTPQARVDVPNFSPGLDDPGLPSFAASQTFNLTNLGPTAKIYALSVAGTFPAGLATSLSVSNLHLAGNQTRPFTFDLSCDNALVPNGPGQPFSYEGTIVLASTTDTLRIPFAFVKAPSLQITYDVPPWTVEVHDRGAYFKWFTYPGNTISMLVPPEPVDVVTLYDDAVTWVVREQLALSVNMSVAISKDEAVFPLAIVPVDENGGPLALTRSMTTAHFGPKTRNFDKYVLSGEAGLPSPTTFHLSSLTAGYLFEVSVLQEAGGAQPIYEFQGHARDGMTAPLTFHNQPSDFRHFTWRYAAEPGGAIVSPWTWISSNPWSGGAVFGFALCDVPAPLTAPFEREAWITPAPDSAYGTGFLHQYVFGSLPPNPCEYSGLLYETPYLFASSTTLTEGHFIWDPAAAFVSADPVLSSGIGPYAWTGRFYNSGDQVYSQGFPWFDFLSQAKDVRPYPPLPFELTQAGAIVGQGTYSGSSSPGPLTLAVTPGVYGLHVPFTSFHMGGAWSRADVRAVFDTGAGDPNPPFLSNLNVSSGGAFVDRVPAGGAVIGFSAGDDTGLLQVALHYKDGSGFRELPLTETEPGVYSADVPASPAPPAGLALAVVLRDADGNALTYSTCSPAAATVEVCNGFDDDCDGSLLAGEADTDEDSYATCTGDCNDLDGLVWAVPGETRGLIVEALGPDALLSWMPPTGGRASGMLYDILRSGSPSDFQAGAVCLASNSGPDPFFPDPDLPAPGGAFFYLVRAENACPGGIGPLGTDSGGVPRAGRSCP